MDYLPEDSPSTVALDVMNRAFDQATSNTRVLVKDVTVPETLEYKQQIKAVEGVKEIQWLDDVVNIYQPLEMLPPKTLHAWYKDNNAVFTLSIDDQNAQQTIDQIRAIIDPTGALSGDAVNLTAAKSSTRSEVRKMMTFLIPVIFLILILTTSSWFEPILFLTVIGISILINMGTNAFLGQISFITQTTAAILQLAISMDYSIFLLHRFAEFRAKGLDVKQAMAEAMKKSFSSILASGLTTILGFAALTLMRFKIGPDMGIVLAKGVFFSLISVMLLLPILTVLTYRIIDKTHHRSFLPSFTGFSRFVARLGVPVIIIVALLLVPAFLAQRQNTFIYGAAAMSSNQSSQIGQDEAQINELFGKSNQMVLLLPTGDPVTEKEFSNALYEIPSVASIFSYVTTVGVEIPSDYLPEKKRAAFMANGYSRMVVTVNTLQESPETFALVETIRNLAHEYYDDTYYLSGGSVNVYDMKNTVTTDNELVTIAAIVAIGIVLLLTFRSLSIPFILLLVIESSIWINLAFPYFAGASMAYIGFMIISSVQLGATVDYAILFANRYLENRQTFPKQEAAVRTIADTTGSILTSAGILTFAGFIMGVVSTNGVIGQLGTLIGRGAALSAAMVLFFLPPMLVLCDQLIQKTTWGLTMKKEDSLR
jgi:predicted RND superfamily exporter protein